jgi:uncharacterized C2H2 Zn-finger protein
LNKCLRINLLFKRNYLYLRHIERVNVE